jgi:hypothetical protein
VYYYNICSSPPKHINKNKKTPKNPSYIHLSHALDKIKGRKEGRKVGRTHNLNEAEKLWLP